METPKRIRKPMTPEALAKLSLARAKANEMRTQNKLTKIDDKKINKLELKMSELKKKKVEKEPVQEEEGETPTEEEVVTPCVIKPKKTVKKKQMVIVEQSSSDEDNFEPNDSVIFVKRTTRKKKELVKDEKVEKEVITMPTPPEIIQPVEYKQPELTQREIFLNATYNNMINGNFLESFPRRR